MRIEYCGICDKGARREVNQDAVFMDAREDMAIFAVADGMGGHMYGEAASGIIVTEIQRWWIQYAEDSCKGERQDFGRLVSALRNQIAYANRVIYEQYNNGTNICGSTIAILLIRGNDYCILSSGDSRIYSWKGLRCRQETVDDVWENQPDIAAVYPPWQLKEHACYGKLIRAVGASKDAVFHERIDGLENRMRFLLCSDGLYKMCREKDVKRILRCYKGNRNGEKLLSGIMRKVYANGARDNTSVILVWCTH